MQISIQVQANKSLASLPKANLLELPIHNNLQIIRMSAAVSFKVNATLRNKIKQLKIIPRLTKQQPLEFFKKLQFYD